MAVIRDFFADPTIEGCHPTLLLSFEFRTAMIGQGAYGIVYKGKKEDTGDIVAIKRIPFSDSTPEGGVPCNVIREISLLRELDHPNVVSLFTCLLALSLLRSLCFRRERCEINALILTPVPTIQFLGPTTGYHSGAPRRIVFGVRVCSTRSQNLHGSISIQRWYYRASWTSRSNCAFLFEANYCRRRMLPYLSYFASRSETTQCE